MFNTKLIFRIIMIITIMVILGVIITKIIGYENRKEKIPYYPATVTIDISNELEIDIKSAFIEIRSLSYEKMDEAIIMKLPDIKKNSRVLVYFESKDIPFKTSTITINYENDSKVLISETYHAALGVLKFRYKEYSTVEIFTEDFSYVYFGSGYKRNKIDLDYELLYLYRNFECIETINRGEKFESL